MRGVSRSEVIGGAGRDRRRGAARELGSARRRRDARRAGASTSSSSAAGSPGSPRPRSSSRPVTRSWCWRRATGSGAGRSTIPSVGGEVVEVGGEWVGPGQDRIIARAKGLGIHTFKTYTKGAQILEYQGKQTHFSGLIPPLPSPDAADFGQLLGKVVEAPGDRPDATARGPPPKRPRSTGQTPRRGSSRTRATPGARFLFDLAVKAVFAADPATCRCSTRCSTSTPARGSSTSPAPPAARQDSRLHRRLPARVDLRWRRGSAGASVLNAPVRRIAQDRGGVTSSRATRERGVPGG